MLRSVVIIGCAYRNLKNSLLTSEWLQLSNSGSSELNVRRSSCYGKPRLRNAVPLRNRPSNPISSIHYLKESNPIVTLPGVAWSSYSGRRRFIQCIHRRNVETNEQTASRLLSAQRDRDRQRRSCDPVRSEFGRCSAVSELRGSDSMFTTTFNSITGCAVAPALC